MLLKYLNVMKGLQHIQSVDTSFKIVGTPPFRIFLNTIGKHWVYSLEAWSSQPLILINESKYLYKCKFSFTF